MGHIASWDRDPRTVCG